MPSNPQRSQVPHTSRLVARTDRATSANRWVDVHPVHFDDSGAGRQVGLNGREQAAEVCAEEAGQFLIEGFELSPSYPARLQAALVGTAVRSCFLGHRSFSADPNPNLSMRARREACPTRLRPGFDCAASSCAKSATREGCSTSTWAHLASRPPCSRRAATCSDAARDVSCASAWTRFQDAPCTMSSVSVTTPCGRSRLAASEQCRPKRAQPRRPRLLSCSRAGCRSG
jgi:hypothetical protein